MKCIYCGKDTQVVDTATASSFILRRRKCLECEKSFYTQELVNNSDFVRKLVRRIKSGEEL